MLVMKLNTYKNYRVCPECKQKLPLARQYFKRLKTPQGKVGFHHTCKECEKRVKINKEWKDGKLLCHCCGEYKEETEFSAKGGIDLVRNDRRATCKSCYTEKQRIRFLSLDPDTKLHKCLNSRLLGAKDRATKHHIPFDLTLGYLQSLWNRQQGLCALSGIKMTYELQVGRTHTNVSIDKIDRNGGYVTGNIQLVCMACNQIKSDLTEDEMYSFCKKIVEHYENKNKENSSAA